MVVTIWGAVSMSRTIDFKRFAFVAALVAMLFAVSALCVSSSDSSDAAGTVTFDPNGGQVTPYVYQPYADSKIYLPGGSFVADDVSYEYTRQGYNFLGWSKSPSASSPEYSEGNVVQVTSNVTLYAVWEPKSYNITFMYGETLSGVVSVPLGSSFDTKPYNLDLPNFAGINGYKITGWSTEKTALKGEGGAVNEYAPKDNANGGYRLSPGAKTYSLNVVLDTPGDITLYPIYSKIYNVQSSYVNINSGSGYYYITGGTSETPVTDKYISIDGGSPRITIENLYMDFSASGLSQTSPITLTNGANVTMQVAETNVLKGRSQYSVGFSYHGAAAINVPSGTTLTISGLSDGTLNAYGGSGYQRYFKNTTYSGPGIGSNGNDPCGNIIINGGTVNAYSGGVTVYGIAKRSVFVNPGIGGTSGTIVINGGTVQAKTGSVSGGSGNNVTIRSPVYQYYTVTGGTLKQGEGSITSGEGTATIRFYVNWRYSDVAYMSIDGKGMPLNGLRIPQGYSTITVPADMIHNGSSVSLLLNSIISWWVRPYTIQATTYTM
jgi:uncharacterized repeat protein (TIGR02543 family)